MIVMDCALIAVAASLSNGIIDNRRKFFNTGTYVGYRSRIGTKQESNNTRRPPSLEIPKYTFCIFHSPNSFGFSSHTSLDTAGASYCYHIVQQAPTSFHFC